jgi:hypothetical protein
MSNASVAAKIRTERYFAISTGGGGALMPTERSERSVKMGTLAVQIPLARHMRAARDVTLMSQTNSGQTRHGVAETTDHQRMGRNMARGWPSVSGGLPTGGSPMRGPARAATGCAEFHGVVALETSASGAITRRSAAAGARIAVRERASIRPASGPTPQIMLRCRRL